MPKGHYVRTKTKFLKDRILEILEDDPDKIWSARELAGEAYAMDPEGGPLWAESYISRAVTRLMKDHPEIERVRGWRLKS